MKSTRIATYNVWNSVSNWDQRLVAITDEICALGADIIALQEAPNEADTGVGLAAFLERNTPYRYVVHVPYPPEPADERPEGLALLSQLPIVNAWTSWGNGGPSNNNFAATIHVDLGGRTLGITNVHLDWQNPAGRLSGITDMMDDLIDRHPAEIEILCGDFNDYEDGSTARQIEAHANATTNSRWRDMVAASVAPGIAPVTIDFIGNPRWRGLEVSERPGRFDRIYARCRHGAVQVRASGVFGREPRNRYGIIPSDHYGVFVDLELGCSATPDAEGGASSASTA